MKVRRVLSLVFVPLVVLSGFAFPVFGEECSDGGTWDPESGSCVQDEAPQAVSSHRECRDGRLYVVTEYDDGTVQEEDSGACEAWVVASWCEGPERIEEWTDETGERWQERHHDEACSEPQTHEDPYGCDTAAGEWWDHYLARCVSEQVWKLQESFWACIDEAYRALAEEQKRLDVAAREARHERRALEERAMEYERAGRWAEAERIWEDLRRSDWEDQKRFHALEARMADATASCIDEYSARAREIGADFLIREFEMHRHGTMTPILAPPPEAMGSSCEIPPRHEYYQGETDHPSEPPRTMEAHEGATHGDDPYGDEPRPASPQRTGIVDCHEPMRAEPAMEPPFALPAEAQAAVKEAMLWCEEQMRALDTRRFAAATYEDARALDEEARSVEAECRSRMEAIFREHAHHDAHDFDRHFGGFTMTETDHGIEVLGMNLLFTGNPEQSRLRDLSCQGTPVLESVVPYFEIEDVVPTGPHKLAFFDRHLSDRAGPEKAADLERHAFMVVHDDPRCTITVQTQNAEDPEAEVRLVFSSLYACQRDDDLVLCRAEDGTEIRLRIRSGDPVLVDGRTLIVRGHVVLRLAGDAHDPHALEEYEGHERFDGSAAVARKDGKIVAQEVTVGDLQMRIDSAEAGEGVRISLDKASHVGSFVVVKLDLDEACAFQVEGWAVDGDARERLETRRATNLADALDAEYDGDYAKYYTVRDEAGCQLIITNGHYSVKEFVVQPVAAQGGLLGIPGPGVVLIAMTLLVGGMLLRRRRL